MTKITVRRYPTQVTALKINTGLRKTSKGHAGLLRNTQTNRPASAPASSFKRSGLAKSSQPRSRASEFASVKRLSRPRSAAAGHAGHTNAYNNKGEEIPRYL